MNPEEAIQLADEVLLAHAGNPLTDIQRMILRESLAGKGYESMEGYAPQHIKNEGKGLWDLLSEALEEKVRKTNFKGALEKRLKSGGMVPKPPQPSNYDEQTWAGRETAVSTLLLKLQGQTHILWLTGISGIGKTALGECLASQAWKNDPSFQWIYVEILEGQSKDFASVAADLLAKLGDRDLDPQERNNPEHLAKRLLKKLQAHPYWIQLDALERLLDPEQPTEFVDGYWTTFLQRCLIESNLVSRLVLTAQVLPDALVDFGDRYPNAWTEIRLSGLSDVNQRLEFFTKRGVVVEEAQREILTHIAAIYEGHPLVIKVIAEDILKEFSGDVLRYWQVNQREFEQVARELQDARLDETEYNEALDRKVRERIRKSLEQLSADALDLLCWSSVFRRPVPKKFWLAMINDRSILQHKAAYRILNDRALIEKEDTFIRQHNLIRDVAYNLLKADFSAWETAERQAAHLWLTAYEPAPDASNLETMRGYLETFNHYCEVKDWEEASKVLLHHVNGSIKQELHQRLQTWGYYKEAIQMYTQMLDSTAPWIRYVCLDGLGRAYIDLENPSKAIEYFEESLEIAYKMGNISMAGAALGNVGLAYNQLKQYRQAVEFYKRSLLRVHRFDPKLKGSILSNLGNCFYDLGNYSKAVKIYRKSFDIAFRFNDSIGMVVALASLGAIQIEKEIIEKGVIEKGIFDEVFDYLSRALGISKEIQYQPGEATIHANLAELYQKTNQLDLAKQHCQQALMLATELGIPLAEECQKLMEELEERGAAAGK